MSVKKYRWTIHKSLIAQTNQDSTFSRTVRIQKCLT